MNRRALLAAAAAAGLSGCGEAARGGRKPAATETATTTATATPAAEAELLRPLIEIKARAVALYGTYGLKTLRAHERAHLRALLEAAGGRPYHYRVRTPPLELERQSLATQLELLPRLSDPGLRTLIAGMYATDAEHLAVLRRAAGRDPVPRAFVTGGR